MIGLGVFFLLAMIASHVLTQLQPYYIGTGAIWNIPWEILQFVFLFAGGACFAPLLFGKRKRKK